MNIDEARALADQIRAQMPDKAKAIDALIAAANGQHNADLKIKVGIKYRLEKFDGDYEPGKKPVEVIEGVDEIT